jgi:hypothetical protein
MDSHLVAQPGAALTLCGLKRAKASTTWARWMGAHELGHAFAGRPLPAWCGACVLALARQERE